MRNVTIIRMQCHCFNYMTWEISTFLKIAKSRKYAVKDQKMNAKINKLSHFSFETFFYYYFSDAILLALGKKENNWSFVYLFKNCTFLDKILFHLA